MATIKLIQTDQQVFERLKREVADAHNACHDWCIAQGRDFVGSAPDHMVAAMRDAEERLADHRKAMVRRIAEANGWRYSPAHDGWIHDDERNGPNEADYVVQTSAWDACWLHDIEVPGQ